MIILFDCLICNKLILRSSILKVNILFNGIIVKLDVYWINIGCEWIEKYEDYVEYLNMCGKLLLKCENVGCGEIISREEMVIYIG